jgi:crotonobetainyl-CoA:carnitine CoA-transferase CaiB-like acyl-CoA transferase
VSWALAAGDQDQRGPLWGVRVLDFSTLLPGPYATQILADLGADVVKLESPRGDEARRFANGMYAVANRNKRAVVADLTNDRERAATLALAAEADVVVEGFRPGVMDRLGVGYEAVRKVRPAIVYCSITGFGQNGPNRDKPGHDISYLAASGGLAYSAHWQQGPRRSGVPIADLAGASFATIAILSALRERDRDGSGCHLDVSIADATMAFASPRGGPSFSVADEERLSVYPTNDLFAAADGAVLAVAAVEEKFWAALRSILAEYEPELADHRFDDEAGRRRHGDELQALLGRAFGRRDAAEWEQAFAASDVSVERVLSLAEAAHGPQARSRGVVATLGGEEQVVFPVLRDGSVMGSFRSPAPAHGQHSEQLLGARGRDG